VCIRLQASASFRNIDTNNACSTYVTIDFSLFTVSLCNLDLFVTFAKEDMKSSFFVRLSVCLLATLRTDFQMDLHEIFREE